MRYVLLRMFPTALEVTFDTDGEFDRSFFARYPFFLSNLKGNFEHFVEQLISKLRKQVERYITATTDSIRVNMGTPEEPTECVRFSVE